MGVIVAPTGKQATSVAERNFVRLSQAFDCLVSPSKAIVSSLCFEGNDSRKESRTHVR